jgi:hypothetical protein
MQTCRNICLHTYLVRVSHHEQVAAGAGQLLHQLKLAQVGVLALINQHVAPAPVHCSLHLRNAAVQVQEQQDGTENGSAIFVLK